MRTSGASADRRRSLISIFVVGMGCLRDALEGIVLLVQVTRSSTRVLGGEDDFRAARKRFDDEHALLLPGLLDADLLAFIGQQLEHQAFTEEAYEELSGTELSMQRGPLYGMLQMMMNRSQLFEAVQRITACGHLGCFKGRVYRMLPGGAHYAGWHTDLGDHRLVTMSVNLGAEEYAGGLLEIREAGSSTTMHRIANTGPGDAVIFRISDRFEHRVTPVGGAVAKTAYAGWFCSQPEFIDLLKENAV